MAATDSALSQYWIDQNAPQLQYKKIWAAGISYYFRVESISWLADVMTIVARNHNLAINNVISLLSNYPSTALNYTNKTVTVINADTFTIPVIGDPGEIFPKASGSPIFEEVVTITSNNYSRLLFKPSQLQVNTLTGADTVIVQVKTHPEAPWISLQTLSVADSDILINLTQIYNFVRLARGVGSTQVVAFTSS